MCSWRCISAGHFERIRPWNYWQIVDIVVFLRNELGECKHDWKWLLCELQDAIEKAVKMLLDKYKSPWRFQEILISMIACPQPKLWLATQIAHQVLTAKWRLNLDFADKRFASFPGLFIRKIDAQILFDVIFLFFIRTCFYQNFFVLSAQRWWMSVS